MKYKCLKCGDEFDTMADVKCPKCGATDYDCQPLWKYKLEHPEKPLEVPATG